MIFLTKIPNPKGIKRLLCSFLLGMLPNVFWAQSQIKIEQADKLFFDKTQGNAQKLLGNVKFSHQNAVMHCDSAYFFSETNRVDAFGNIHIIENDTLHLFGDTLHYFGNTKKIKITGNVLLQTQSIELKTNQLLYDRQNNTAYYIGGGEITHKSQQLKLTGKTGTYNVAGGLFSFKHNVQLTHPDFTLQADTFQYQYRQSKAIFISPTYIQLKDSVRIYTENGWYLLKKGVGEYYFPTKIFFENREISADTLWINQKELWAYGRSGLKVTDTANAVILGAQYGYINQREDSVFLTQLPYLQQFADSDTLTFIADTIIITQDSLSPNVTNVADSLKPAPVRHIYAYRNVRFFKKDLQGKCDSMVYHSTDSLLQLFTEPVIWSGINQMTADSVSMKIFDGNINRLYLRQNAFICSLTDSVLGFYDQISGKNMTGYFHDNKITKVFVEKNAQTLYYALDDNGKYIGVNKAFASNLEIRFKKEKIHRIVYLSKPSAKFIPLKQMAESDKFFKGFRWRAKQKPYPEQFSGRYIPDKLPEIMFPEK